MIRHEDPALRRAHEHRFRPRSTGPAIPVFAFFSAGVAVDRFDAAEPARPVVAVPAMAHGVPRRRPPAGAPSAGSLDNLEMHNH